MARVLLIDCEGWEGKAAPLAGKYVVPEMRVGSRHCVVVVVDPPRGPTFAVWRTARGATVRRVDR